MDEDSYAGHNGCDRCVAKGMNGRKGGKTRAYAFVAEYSEREGCGRARFRLNNGGLHILLRRVLHWAKQAAGIHIKGHTDVRRESNISGAMRVRVVTSDYHLAGAEGH